MRADDVIVVGSGIAGLICALALAPRFVTLITKTPHLADADSRRGSKRLLGIRVGGRHISVWRGAEVKKNRLGYRKKPASGHDDAAGGGDFQGPGQAEREENPPGH